MAKKIRFESFVYRFLVEADSVHLSIPASTRETWQAFIAGLQFRYEKGNAVIGWDGDKPGTLEFSLSDPDLYHRGDDDKYIAEQRDNDLIFGKDWVQSKNAGYFRRVLMQVAAQAGIDLLMQPATPNDADGDRLKSEESFHDQWASSEDLGAIDIKKVNEACTSPEMRYIRAQLGPLAGKRLLDVGCGLGEASVYFAIEGASVTSMDISQGMLDVTTRLANSNGVTVRIHKAAAEKTNLPDGELFDVIYAGNLLHHVDIEATLKLLKPHVAPGGVFVSWDPIAYNPIINVYRAIATKVRTPDEHPLQWRDIRLFRREFKEVKTKYFWFTTLFIFIWMAVVQRRNPNKERFWKAVVNESERWEPLYRALSKLDAFLLAFVPPLRLLCWNVVIIAKSPT